MAFEAEVLDAGFECCLVASFSSGRKLGRKQAKACRVGHDLPQVKIVGAKVCLEMIVGIDAASVYLACGCCYFSGEI